LEGVTEFGFIIHYAPYGDSDDETRTAFEEIGRRVGCSNSAVWEDRAVPAGVLQAAAQKCEEFGGV
jgi:hypothetical protein